MATVLILRCLNKDMDSKFTSNQIDVMPVQDLIIVETFSLEDDEECEYNPTLMMKAFYALMFLISVSVGNCLLYCIIIYEKFGMDSQKRTVTNQLLSSICGNLIVFNSFFLLIKAIQQIFDFHGKDNLFYLLHVNILVCTME